MLDQILALSCQDWSPTKRSLSRSESTLLICLTGRQRRQFLFLLLIEHRCRDSTGSAHDVNMENCLYYCRSNRESMRESSSTYENIFNSRKLFGKHWRCQVDRSNVSDAQRSMKLNKVAFFLTVRIHRSQQFQEWGTPRAPCGVSHVVASAGGRSVLGGRTWLLRSDPTGHTRWLYSVFSPGKRRKWSFSDNRSNAAIWLMEGETHNQEADVKSILIKRKTRKI